MTAMQNLFTNQSVGRVLVSDYTTKAEFIIPDLEKVIGPSKYDVVNRDIKEGLQNVILAEEKFANATIKAQLFLQRLKESREAFLHEFLQPEINQICKNFGFRGSPRARFQDIDMKDENQVQRVITRMMELGILPPEEGMKVIDTGVFPSERELEKAQEKFLDDRKKGWYNPLVGGVPVFEESEEMELEEIKHPESMRILDEQKNKTPKSPGRPAGSKTQGRKVTYAVDSIKEVIDATNKFYSDISVEAKKVFKKKRLSSDQKQVLEKVCELVVSACEQANWKKTAISCLKDNKKLLGLKTLSPVSDISVEHSLDEYSSAILYHSIKNSPKD
jgi:DNA-binding transcriptional regulator GbsR (MarR family)